MVEGFRRGGGRKGGPECKELSKVLRAVGDASLRRDSEEAPVVSATWRRTGNDSLQEWSRGVVAK